MRGAGRGWETARQGEGVRERATHAARLPSRRPPCSKPSFLPPSPRALSEDFLQHNGTPGAAAPIALAAQRDEEAEEQQQAAPAACQARPVSGDASPDPPTAAPRQHQAQLSSTDGGGGGDDAACGGLAQGAPSPPPGSSPSKRGGIQQPQCSRLVAVAALAPLRAGVPPLPVQHFLHQLQASQQHAAQAGQAGQQGQGQPGTPLTPSSSTGAFSGSLQRQSAGPSGFLRSMSVDSENPSLGFNMREALAGLR